MSNIPATSAPLTESQRMLEMIERVIMNPDVTIEKLQTLLEMQERVVTRSAQQSFAASLSEMQVELPRIAEAGKGHGTIKYALLEDINDQLRPILYKHGFAVTFRVSCEVGAINVRVVLSHRDGHSEETTIPLMADTSGSKSGVQAVGSAISYGKRYGICAMLNISTGDDNDGAKPVETISGVQAGVIKSLLLQADVTEEQFCKSARIASVGQLQPERYDSALTKIYKTIAAKADAAPAGDPA